MQETGTTSEAQNLYIFLENIDHLQSLWLQAWAHKQEDLEEKRRECLSSMASMFPKVGLPCQGSAPPGRWGREASQWGRGVGLGVGRREGTKRAGAFLLSGRKGGFPVSIYGGGWERSEALKKSCRRKSSGKGRQLDPAVPALGSSSPALVGPSALPLRL